MQNSKPLTTLDAKEIEQLKRAKGWDELVAKAFGSRFKPSEVADFVDAHLRTAFATSGNVAYLDRDATLSARAGTKLKDEHVRLSHLLATEISKADRANWHSIPKQKSKVAKRLPVVMRGFSERRDNGGKTS
jgi:hypothetical protein